MALTVDFWVFSKKENSTKTPTGTATASYSCTLKENCGVVNPTIVLNVGTSGNPTSYTYCKIGDFQNRYYFVRDWVFENGLWVANLSIDVLGTYKTVIGNSTQYVLRSSSSYDSNIVDNYYPTKAGITYSGQAIDHDPWGTPTIVMGIAGGGDVSAGSMGAVQYYAFTMAQAKNLYRFLLGGANVSGTTMESLLWTGLSIVDESIKATFNPLQYITSAMWFPFDSTSEGEFVSTIKFGKWSLPCAGYILGGTPYHTHTNGNFELPKHPQASTRGLYLNDAPFSSYSLYFQPFGIIPINSADIKNTKYIRTSLITDLISGQGHLSVKCLTDDLLQETAIVGEYWANIGCAVPLAQVTQNLVQPALNFINALGSLGTGNFIGGLGQIGNAIDSSMPQVAISGTTGSTLYPLLYYPAIVGRFRSIVNANNDHAGRPLCQEKQISTLSGFVKCADGEFDISCTEQERTQISNYLTGGFFYE